MVYYLDGVQNYEMGVTFNALIQCIQNRAKARQFWAQMNEFGMYAKPSLVSATFRDCSSPSTYGF